MLRRHIDSKWHVYTFPVERMANAINVDNGSKMLIITPDAHHSVKADNGSNFSIDGTGSVAWILEPNSHDSEFDTLMAAGGKIYYFSSTGATLVNSGGAGTQFKINSVRECLADR